MADGAQGAGTPGDRTKRFRGSGTDGDETAGIRPRPRVPAPVRRVTEAVFAGLARFRDARPFHPVGRSFTATFTPRPGQPLDFLGADARPALLRLSNAAGLPAWLPDVFGIAVRIPNGAGPGRPQDFLLSSSGGAPVARHLLVPARSFSTRRYSSLLLYRHRGARRLVGARFAGAAPRRPLRLADVDEVAADGGLAFTLALCSPLGAWQRVGNVQAHHRLPAAASEQLRFHPWNTAPELRPVGWLNHLRGGAYDGSQRAATSE